VGNQTSQYAFERIRTTYTSGFASILFARWKEYSCDAQIDFGRHPAFFPILDLETANTEKFGKLIFHSQDLCLHQKRLNVNICAPKQGRVSDPPPGPLRRGFALPEVRRSGGLAAAERWPARRGGRQGKAPSRSRAEFWSHLPEFRIVACSIEEWAFAVHLAHLLVDAWSWL
jgi:hypothetical protein